MTERSINPFLSFAKSNDLTDEQISDLWVGFDGPPNVHPLFDPASPMATIVLGGKGSGKTHLFRYFSYPVQTKRYGDGDWLPAIFDDGYMGIYTRAAGLNCSRFYGKGIDEERWKEVFRYYMELWLGQEFLDIASLLASHVRAVADQQDEIVGALTHYVDLPTEADVKTFSDFGNFLRKFQRSLDQDVNRAAFSGEIDPDLRCSPGDMVFGFPETLAKYLGEPNAAVFVYYIDECENLLEYQQRHVNTLLRDRKLPVTFRIGARSYGMRTYETDSGEGEKIQEDSEYQLLRLDERMRREKTRYNGFVRDLLARRVRIPGSVLTTTDMANCFPATARWQPGDQITDRPHVERLRKRLSDAVDPIFSEAVLAALRFDEDPVVEKAAIFMFYKAVADGKSDLRAEATKIARLLSEYTKGVSNGFASTISHYRGDFVAQMRRDAHQRRGSGEDNHFTGLENFVKMSEGLPRSLLTIVGESVKSATFRSELPSAGQSISAEAQYDGVRYASDWFFSDVPQGGEAGEAIQRGIMRLGELFRMNRFADKPIECSLIAFSVCIEAISPGAREVILEAERRSFLIKTDNPQNDKAGRGVWDKFRLNRIFCPKFDLPLGMRGAVRLDTSTANAIFGSNEGTSFDQVMGQWRNKLEWPFGRKDFRSEQLF